MIRRRRAVELFNLSFLDVISCGFGAIVLLLLIVKISEPYTTKTLTVDLSGQVARLESEWRTLQGERMLLLRRLEERERELDLASAERARRRQALAAATRDYAELRTEREALARIEGELADARQELSEEMRRLLGDGYRRPVGDATIGGVPVDSEYIIFIIDTSGSMNRFAWPMVQKKIAEVLAIYPGVKGIQVMNDMGDYMFPQYSKRWIPDTPARRRAILERLGSWSPFSNSSPVEGIQSAIRTFYDSGKRISLYVFGDDFSQGSIDAVIETVNRLNRADASGNRRVRIHAVGFPVLFDVADGWGNVVRFAALMRKLAETNSGSFVGLNSLAP